MSNWWRDVTVNLLGVFHLCCAVLPDLRERGSGRVINVVGGGTRGPFPFASGYACGKPAVMRFTETLAEELTEAKSAVKVFALSPGFVRTRMTEQFADKEAGRKWMGGLIARLEARDVDAPERAAEMVVVIATGALDELHGRYLHSAQDLEDLKSLRDHAEDIAEEDTRTLRIQ
jgi:NAD(P)-dependent dehydrogenase (short-subunit alcohol dehydrogenase family)